MVYFEGSGKRRFAFRTGVGVHTQPGTAVPAGIALLLTQLKRFRAHVLQVEQVLNQAGMVFQPVAAIQLFQPFTGEIGTIIAVTGSCFCQRRTIRDDAPVAVRWFCIAFTPTTGTGIFCPLICIAGSAVEATRGNGFNCVSPGSHNLHNYHHFDTS